MLCLSVTAAGRTLSLDSCRAMALRSNKQMSIARVKHEAAVNARKMARTKYLPHVDLAGGYMYSSREVSLLNDDQKYKLSNLGTLSMSKLNSIGSNVAAAFNGGIEQKLTGLVQQGLMTPDEAQRAGNLIQTISSTMSATAGSTLAPSIEGAVNHLGEKIVEAFRTNTHHIITASALLTQPIYMGGAITAGNKMADIAEHVAETSIEAREHDVL